MDIHCNKDNIIPLLVDKLIDKGIKPTPQRLAVYEYVWQHQNHPDAATIRDALIDRFPTLSLTTIYSTLKSLTEVDLLREVNIDPVNVRYDIAECCEHGHFRCAKCGRIIDFPLPPRADIPLLHSMKVTGYDIYVSGVCDQCLVSD